MKQSTRDILKLHGWRLDRFAHHFFYYIYYDYYVRAFLWLGKFVVRHFRGWRAARFAYGQVFERYHAKTVRPTEAAKLVQLDHDVVLNTPMSERVIPYDYANKIILEEPEYIAVMDCPCRLSRDNPCQPINTCLAVGRVTANFWIEHGARLHSRRITSEEAIEILEREHGKGRAITAWLKVATGGRTGVICSCCGCCCGAIEGERLAASLGFEDYPKMFAPSGYSPRYDAGSCTGCLICVETCPFDALSAGEDGLPVYLKDRCKGCGACVAVCESGARTLVLDPEMGEPMDIDNLEKWEHGE